jgi:transposase
MSAHLAPTPEEAVPRNLRALPRPIARQLSRTVLELRQGRLSAADIAHVLDLYEGVTLTEHQVHDWLHRLGVPKNPNKIRGASAASARRARVAA